MENHSNMESNDEIITNLLNPSLCDKILILAEEYSVSAQILINVAVKRLIDDVDILRLLRMGKIDKIINYLSS